MHARDIDAAVHLLYLVASWLRKMERQHTTTSCLANPSECMQAQVQALSYFTRNTQSGMAFAAPHPNLVQMSQAGGLLRLNSTSACSLPSQAPLAAAAANKWTTQTPMSFCWPLMSGCDCLVHRLSGWRVRKTPSLSRKRMEHSCTAQQTWQPFGIGCKQRKRTGSSTSQISAKPGTLTLCSALPRKPVSSSLQITLGTPALTMSALGWSWERMASASEHVLAAT